MTASLSFLRATIRSLKALHTVECPGSLGRGAKLLADVSATSSNFAMAEYHPCTFISIPTIRVRMNRGFDGARIVSGDVDGDSSIRGFIETDAATRMI